MGFIKDSAIITGTVTGLTALAYYWPKGAVEHHALAEASAKLLPTAVALKPVATAILAKVATATPIPEVTRVAATNISSIEHQYDPYIIGGIIVVCIGAGVYFFGHALLESILGGPAVRLGAKEKNKIATGNVVVETDQPRELVRALIASGAEPNVSAEIAPNVFIAVKAVASIKATQEVLKDHPELLSQINDESAKLEKRLVNKARILG